MKFVRLVCIFCYISKALSIIDIDHCDETAKTVTVCRLVKNFNPMIAPNPRPMKVKGRFYEEYCDQTLPAITKIS